MVPWIETTGGAPETNERMRETHKPDWTAVALGVAVMFIAISLFGALGIATDALNFKPNDSRAILVVKTLYLLTMAAIAGFWGGFAAGRATGERNRIAAVMNGMLVWEFTIMALVAATWLEWLPLPNFQFRSDDLSWGPYGMLFAMVLTGIPNLYATIFGAMKGNDRVPGYAAEPAPSHEVEEPEEERKAA
jgi:hypothetical protein